MRTTHVDKKAEKNNITKEAIKVQEVVEEDRQPDSDVDLVSDVGSLSDGSMGGLEQGAGSSSSTRTIYSAELVWVVENSQVKMGKLLLKEQEKRYLKMEASLKHMMQELRKDVLKSVDAKIDERLDTAMKEVKGMLEEARKSAAQAQAAACKAAAVSGGSAGGAASPRASAAATWAPWTPRTLEVKGFCDWPQRSF